MRARAGILLVCSVVWLALPGGPADSAAPVSDGSNSRPESGAVPDASRAKDAATRALTLSTLFAALKITREESTADRLVNRIWMTWSRYGNAKIDDLISLAVIYTNEGEHDEALKVLDELIALAPDFAEAWNRRATLLYLMGEYDRSLLDIRKTLKLEPRHFGALAGRGLIYNARGQYKLALQAFEQALMINPFLTERRSLIPVLRQKLGEQKI